MDEQREPPDRGTLPQPAVEETRAPGAFRRRPRLTAGAVGAGATLIAALATLLTAVQGWFPTRGSNGTTATTPTLTEATTTVPSVLERLIYSDRLLQPGAFSEEKYGGCTQSFTDLGYQISVNGKFIFCDDSGGSAALSGLRSVRIEVTAVWTTVPPGSYRHFGAGDASLRCRGEGTASNTTGYHVGLTSSGAWEITRYVEGKQTTLAEGRDVALDPSQGDAQRLRLDCLQLDNGDVRLSFYVDDARVASFTDAASPAPPGVIGVVAGSFTKDPFVVTFRDLRVYGP